MRSGGAGCDNLFLVLGSSSSAVCETAVATIDRIHDRRRARGVRARCLSGTRVTRRRGCPSRLGARVISPGPRGTRLYRAGRTFFRQKKIKPTTLHPRHRPATRPTRPPPCPKPPQTNHTPKPHTRVGAHTRAPRAPNARGRAHTRARAQKSKKKFRYRDSNPSLLGVSARAGAAVKAKYDNPIVRC